MPCFRSFVFFSLTFVFPYACLAHGEELYPESRLLCDHTGSVLCVEFTHDAKTLVSSSRDSSIKIWDLDSGKVQRTLNNHTADVYCVVFSNDGKLMASGSVDTKIILWDAKTFEPIRTLEGHTAAIREAEFSPDDKTLASVGEDCTFRLWDVETGNLKVTRSDHKAKVKSVSYYPDGSTIATISHDLTLRLWDAATGAQKLVLTGHKDVIEDCAVSPDGKQLFSGSGTNYGQLMFWDAETGETLHDLPLAHGNQLGKEIDAVCYTPDGKWAVSGAKDRAIKFWDPKTFELRYTISGNPGRIESMSFSPDGKLLATGFGGEDYTIKVWELGNLEELHGEPESLAGR
jgi:WD40 repeat protein